MKREIKLFVAAITFAAVGSLSGAGLEHRRKRVTRRTAQAATVTQAVTAQDATTTQTVTPVEPQVPAKKGGILNWIRNNKWKAAGIGTVVGAAIAVAASAARGYCVKEEGGSYDWSHLYFGPLGSWIAKKCK